MKTIGLTGPSGAGKTTVLAVLEELGCLAIDCDRVYHRLLEESPPLVEELTDRFGRSILDSQGNLSRRALAQVVFGDQEALLALNRITHRRVRREVEDRLELARRSGHPGAVIDAVALVESGLDQLCDVTAAVLAPRVIRLRRIMARDGLTEAQAAARINAQPPDSFYRQSCSILIENDGLETEPALRARVSRLFRPILEL